ncbi:MAG: shikimate dehydrogenase family protein [Planctomycetota bacterium]|jgi:shikimate 5-dehydrogenase
MGDTAVKPPWTPRDPCRAAEQPSMYFIGVTTHHSSIMKVFPRWAEYLKLGDVVMQGMNFRWHDEPENYRRAVAFIKDDPLSFGALVTTHKLDLLEACRDQFDRLDEFAELMHEISSISKRDGRLVGHAKDPVTSGLALEALLPERHWVETQAEALVLGAGGSAVALTWYLLRKEHGPNRPSRIIVTNRSKPRLEAMQSLHQRIGADVPIEYHHTPSPQTTDEIVARLKPGSLVVNATGLGKDAPGSPLTDAARWPENGIAWDFNYRGDLVFLDQARSQQAERNLRIEDGWIYFIHGWTRVIAEVFHVEIPTSGPMFDELSAIAAAER